MLLLASLSSHSGMSEILMQCSFSNNQSCDPVTAVEHIASISYCFSSVGEHPFLTLSWAGAHLPTVFKRNNYAAFVRRLTTHGFCKPAGLGDNSKSSSERGPRPVSLLSCLLLLRAAVSGMSGSLLQCQLLTQCRKGDINMSQPNERQPTPIHNGGAYLSGRTGPPGS